MAKDKPVRTVSSGNDRPAQLYLFVEEFVSNGKLSSRGARIVKALHQFADDIVADEPIEIKYTVRQVRVIPKPSSYPPARVRAVRELIGASQDVFAQLLA